MIAISPAATWTLLAALAACSGKSTRAEGNAPNSRSPHGDAGEAGAGGQGSQLGGAGGARPSSAGAAADGSTLAGSDSRAAGAAGEAPTVIPTVLCEDDRDCAIGAQCTSIQYSPQRACLRPCDADGTCAGETECVTLDGRALGCAPHCEWPWDCEFAFDCITHSPSESYVCVPVRWAAFILNQ